MAGTEAHSTYIMAPYPFSPKMRSAKAAVRIQTVWNMTLESVYSTIISV